MDPWIGVANLGRQQHGIVTRQQCLALGVASSTLSEHARRFGWRTVHPGVFALPGTAGTFAQQAAGALLALGPPAMLTAGAALHVLGVVSARPRGVALLVPDRRALPQREGIAVIRTAEFERVRSLTRGMLRLARSPRAAADHARDAQPLQLARLMAKACGLRHASLPAFAGELAARGRFPGRASFRSALAMLQGELTHSRAEQTARRHARTAGIEVWPRPYPVEHFGRLIAEIDLAVPALRYGAEIDGPHHDLPEQAAADKQRDRELRRVGWTIDRFPVEFVENHPQHFVRELRAALCSLAPAGIPSGSNEQ